MRLAEKLGITTTRCGGGGGSDGSAAIFFDVTTCLLRQALDSFYILAEVGCGGLPPHTPPTLSGERARLGPALPTGGVQSKVVARIDRGSNMTEAQKPETPVKPDDGTGGVSADDRSREHRIVHAWQDPERGFWWVLGSNGRVFFRGSEGSWHEIATYPPGLEP